MAPRSRVLRRFDVRSTLYISYPSTSNHLRDREERIPLGLLPLMSPPDTTSCLDGVPNNPVLFCPSTFEVPENLYNRHSGFKNTMVDEPFQKNLGYMKNPYVVLCFTDFTSYSMLLNIVRFIRFIYTRVTLILRTNTE